MGKSTISMAIFNSKLLVYQRVATPAQILTFRPRNRFDMINPQPPSLPIKWLHHLDILYPEKTLFDTVWFNLSFISISSSVFSPFHLNQSPEKNTVHLHFIKDTGCRSSVNCLSWWSPQPVQPCHRESLTINFYLIYQNIYCIYIYYIIPHSTLYPKIMFKRLKKS